MLVITGAQRSGTSLMARLLKDSGYNVGSRLGDEAGELENEVVSAFYREYLGDPTFPYDDAKLPYLCEYNQIYSHGWTGVFANYHCDVCKFSFLTMNPAFVYIWHKFRPPSKGDKFLVMLRNEHHIVQSKVRMKDRFKHDSELLNLDAPSLARNRALSCYLLDSLGYKLQYLPFPRYLADLEETNKVLSYLNSKTQIRREVWEDVVDTSKVHFR